MGTYPLMITHNDLQKYFHVCEGKKKMSFGSNMDTKFLYNEIA